MKPLRNLLLTNNLITGIAIGIASALAITGVFTILNNTLLHTRYLQGNTSLLIGIGVNLIIMRFYFLKYKLEKTGRGILVITFLLTLLFFIFLKENGAPDVINRIFNV